MGITINGPSGIDDASLIDQLVALEQDKVTVVQDQVSSYQTQISDYSTLKSYVADLATKAQALNTTDDFGLFTATSSDSSSVTISGTGGAAADSYNVSVYHMAQSEKMISKDGLVTSQTAALSSFGVNTGVISIDGTQITIDANDTIQDLRSKINSATDSSGNKLNVTASVLQISANDFRLVLSSNNTGAAGDTYQDVSGTTLQDLGIVTDPAGDKGSTAQTLTSQGDVNTQTDFNSMFNNLAVGGSITFSGVDHDGNAVSNTFVKKATSTINDFLTQVNTTYHGMANATVDATTGNLVITDNVTGNSQLAMNSLQVGTTAEAVGITQSGENGAGVLQVGSDAYFNLDGLYMTNSSNNPDNIITGVTLNFLKASPTSTTSVSLAYDITGLQQKVQDILDSYNTLMTWANSETTMPDTTAAAGSDAAKGGDLAGDMTVTSITDQLHDALESDLNLFGGTVNSLAALGVQTDPDTGQMSIDSTTFQSVATKSFDEFQRLFVTDGICSNKDVTYGRSTDTTSSGAYTLHEDASDPDHVQIQIAGDSTWYTSDSRIGDVVTFSSGPASGLSITSPSGILVGQDATLTFQSGLSDILNNICANITDGSTGTIANHVDSLNSLMSDANDRITTMQTHVDDYRTQLQNQFAAMEEALQSMKSQYNQMASALGLTSISTTSSSSSSTSSSS
jgi:flagellar capping protein FliD